MNVINEIGPQNSGKFLPGQKKKKKKKKLYYSSILHMEFKIFSLNVAKSKLHFLRSELKIFISISIYFQQRN